MAYTFHKLHTSQVIESLVETSLQHSKMYIDHARNFIRQKPSDSVSFLCGNSGIFAVSSVINQSLGNLAAVEEDLNQFKKGATVCLKASFNRQGNDEMLFGRGGYLSGIYWLNSQLPLQQRFPTYIASNIAEITILTGSSYAVSVQSSVPLLWVCYNEHYIGAAHGVASILHMLLESPIFASQLLSKDNPLNSTQQLVQSAIDNLMRMQTDDGNFPSILEDEGKSFHKLVQWCHGGPGLFFVFAKAYLIFKEKKYLDCCLKIGDLVWSKGLLRKGVGLCHGKIIPSLEKQITELIFL